jgi:DNA repair exonuclease SbcCD nuclease subunit
MKFAILGDAHAGVRDGNLLMMKHQLEYLENEFIPYLVKNGIKLIVQTGDIFDVRRHTNTAVLAEWKVRFFNVLERLGIKLIIYIGNHDMFLKNKISPNSATAHLSNYSNVQIIETVQNVNIGGTDMLMVPWICAENEEEIMNAISTSESRVCFGHFEIKGAKMESSTCTDGLPLSTFNRFERCISGHFHVAGDYENVQYVGTPYQMSWGDYGIAKGFWIMDSESLEMEFIVNDKEIYHKLTYNEDRNMDLLVDGCDYRDQHIKVVVEHREDFKKYEAWLLRVEVMGAATFTIVEPFVDRDAEDSDIIIDGEIEVLSTTDLIKEYVKDVYPERAEALTKMMLGIHGTARSTFE